MFWLLKKTKKGILGKKNIWHKFLSWKKMVEGESSTRDSENMAIERSEGEATKGCLVVILECLQTLLTGAF